MTSVIGVVWVVQGGYYTRGQRRRLDCTAIWTVWTEGLTRVLILGDALAGAALDEGDRRGQRQPTSVCAALGGVGAIVAGLLEAPEPLHGQLVPEAGGADDAPARLCVGVGIELEGVCSSIQSMVCSERACIPGSGASGE